LPLQRDSMLSVNGARDCLTTDARASLSALPLAVALWPTVITRCMAALNYGEPAAHCTAGPHRRSPCSSLARHIFSAARRPLGRRRHSSVFRNLHSASSTKRRRRQATAHGEAQQLKGFKSTSLIGSCSHIDMHALAGPTVDTRSMKPDSYTSE